jgi:hypothetical protein
VAEDTDLFAELEGDQKNTGGRCSTGYVLSGMEPEQRAEWESAIANPRYTASSLLRAAQRRNIPFSEQSLQRHVRRIRMGSGCQCPR